MLREIFGKAVLSKYNSAPLIIGGSTLATIGVQPYGDGAMLAAGIAGGIAGMAAGRVYDAIGEYVAEKRLQEIVRRDAPKPDRLS